MTAPIPASSEPRHRRGPRTGATAIVLGAVAVILAVVLAVLLWPKPDPAPVAAPTHTAAPAPTPTPTPTPTGFPANTVVYDTAALPQADVFAVIPALPVDTAPDAPFAGFTAHANASEIPVWADPLGEPVASLPAQYTFDGTTVAVIEKQEHWVHVLLTGRQSLPSGGDGGQITGWLRVADVDLAPVDAHVEVSISARTIDIVRGGAAERIATDFAWGAAESPTPVGRSFIMMIRSVPEFGYTRGHPLIYLSVQSPTLDGFSGADAAVTAFHYHDERTGPISNGCIRVDEAVTARLAELPAGTGVFIRP